MKDAAPASVVFGTLRLRNIDIPTETRDIEQASLRFYPDNPRIYSLVRNNGQAPDQEEIYKQLLTHEPATCFTVAAVSCNRRRVFNR
jgi:hypothetical protein